MILTRKINLKLDLRDIEENNKKQYISEIYEYLRETMRAQNRAFNLLTSEIYTAIKKEKSYEEINKIYEKYSRQKPHPSKTRILFLRHILKNHPITEETIKKETDKLKKELLKKKNPPSEQKITEECEKLEEKYRKFIGKTEEEIKQLIEELDNYCAYPQDIFEKFANGLSTPAYVTQQVKEYYNSQPGTDSLKGNASVRNMKMDAPLIIPPNIFYNKSGELIGLTHEYDDYQSFLSDLQTKREVKLFANIPSKEHGKKIKFKLTLGNPAKSQALRNEIQNIFEENYKIRGSKIGFTKNKETKKDTDITLYLSFEVPKQEVELNENVVVGVDLGQKIPAVCALNTNPYASLYIGSENEFLRIRTQMQDEMKRLQKSLSFAKSGKGRKRKLKKLENLKNRESNFVETYSHTISKKIIDFALKYKAKYINLEYLKGSNFDNKILRNWSYYKLQQYIAYKAAGYGIEVRYVNPCFTSQICSNCGNFEEGQRVEQEKFVCANEICRFHNLKKGYINADFNAARNIAKSTLFINKKNEKEINLIEEAAKYYGIPLKNEEEDAA